MLVSVLARQSTTFDLGYFRTKPNSIFASKGASEMTTQNVLAIDAGSSSIRGSIVSSDLRVVASWSVALEASSPVPNFVQYSGDSIEIAVRTILARALADFPEVSAIAISNQRATSALWDAETGKTLGPILSWMDLRTAAMCLGLNAAGFSIAPSQSATKVAFLASLAGDIEPARLRFGTLDTYILWLLTNGESYFTDHTNAAMTGFIQDTSLRWDSRVLQALSLPESILPEIRPSASHFGDYHHSSSIPVLGIIADQQGSLLGQGCLGVGDTKITFGTGTVLDQNVGLVAPADIARGPGGTIPIVAYSDASTITWARESFGLASGSMTNWLLSMGILKDLAQANRIDSAFRSNSQLYVVPANSGLGTPEWDFGARSLMVGLTLATTNDDIVAATLDGIAQISADLFDAAQIDTGIEIDSVRVDGGMTANAPFCQLVADALGMEIRVAPNREASTIGAARLAHGQLRGQTQIGIHGVISPPGRSVSPRTERGSALWESRRQNWAHVKSLSLASLPEFSAIKF